MLLSLPVAFSYLDLRIFANEGEAGVCCNVPATQLCVPKSMCCPVAARSISHIPEETSCQFVSRRMLVWRWYSETNIYLGLSCLFILCCFSSWTSGNKQQVHFHVGKWRLDFSISSLPKRRLGSWFPPGATLFFCLMTAFCLLSLWSSVALQPSSIPMSWSATLLQGNPNGHISRCGQWLGEWFWLF